MRKIKMDGCVGCVFCHNDVWCSLYEKNPVWDSNGSIWEFKDDRDRPDWCFAVMVQVFEDANIDIERFLKNKS